MDHHVNGVQASLPHTAAWRKSSYSNPSGNCLEAAELTGGVALRDSRFPDGPALVFTSATWDAFLRGVRRQQGLRLTACALAKLRLPRKLWCDHHATWETS